MEELICFIAFLYQYIEFFVFLKVARREVAIAPLAPPLYPPLNLLQILKIVQSCTGFWDFQTPYFTLFLWHVASYNNYYIDGMVTMPATGNFSHKNYMKLSLEPMRSSFHR